MNAPLFENEHVVVSALAGEPIMTVVRKATRVELGELEGVWGAAERALGSVDRRRSCLVVDVSAASGRNDEEFEKAFAPLRQRLSAGWIQVALVVSTLPGKLQVQRYAREDDARVTAFDSRGAALEALRRALGTQSATKTP
jgi:hypothetical protein